MLGSKLAWASMAGLLVAIVGLAWFSGSLTVLAQEDITSPTISSIAITSDPDDDTNPNFPLYDKGVYGIGESISVTVTFSEDVTVTGSPRLALNVGGTAKSAAYDSASSSTVAFSYAVATGDSDTDGVSISANKLTLNSGSIKDLADNDADLSHAALSAQSSHKVDGVRPTVSRIAFPGNTFANDQVYTVGEYLHVFVDFSDEVVIIGKRGPTGVARTGNPQLAINVGGTTRQATWTPFPVNVWRGDSWLFLYTVQDGDVDHDGVTVGANALSLNGGTIKDPAGNNATLTHSAAGPDSTAVDGDPATVSSIAITSDPGSDNSYGVHNRIEVTVTFSESVRVPRLQCSWGICMPRLELDIGGVARVAKTHESSTITGTSVVFSYTVQDGDNDSNGVSIGANKLMLNGGSIEDNVGRSGGEDADISHGALADDSGHKVATSSSPPKSNDATLSALTLSGVDFGTFASSTTSYRANVAYGVTETTVTPTVNHSGARYSVKLGGVTDSDGTVSLSVGSNVITVRVVAEDGRTTQTYTVTVTRAASTTPEPLSTDATLSALALSGVSLGTFASSTTSYTASVANSVTETTVTPTANHSGASYVIKLGGVTDDDGTVSLAVGSNVITIEVTAEDGQTKRTYTVTVTRAAAVTASSTDATLSALSLSGVDFGTFVPGTTSYSASVANGVTQTTVTPTVNHSGASYAITLGEVTDADGIVSLSVGSNVITVEVTAEDTTTTQTYTVTVTRAAPLSTDATLKALSLSDINVSAFKSDATTYSVQVANSVSQTTVTPTVNHSGASYVIKLGGVTDADGTVSLSVGSNVITVEVTAEDGQTTEKYTVTVTRAAPSTDATLSALTMSSVDFGTFASGTTSYTASVANSVTQTTVSPTVNDPGASHVIKLGGVTDADGTVPLSVGSNVITVEVTAEDTSTTQTYTVTVTRAAPPSTDASLKTLTLSGMDFGIFDSTTISYTATVANSVSQTTVTPTVNHSGARHVIKLGGVTDAGGTVPLSVGSNVITVEVTAEDTTTTQTYTVTVTRALPPSTDATLSALTMSSVDFGTFARGTTSYTASVANSVSQTTVTPTVNDSGAGYVIKLGGVRDVDGTISLSVGSNVITVEVTAEDTSTTQTYTVTVTRADSPNPELSGDATLRSLALSGVDFGIFDSTTISYTATVANSVSQTKVTPTVNDSGAGHVIKLGGVTDADGTVSLSVGSNVITVEVTAEDTSTTQTYTITVTRAAPPSTDATLSSLILSGIDLGTFASSRTTYSVQAANSVSRTTVTPRVNDPGATYVIRLGGVTDADGTVSLSVGSNDITVEVTAEDDSTTQTYTVTVTRTAPSSTDATLSALTLSGVDFGTFDSTTASYTAAVANSMTQTKVTPTVSNSGASYVIKLGGVTDSDGTVSLSEGINVVTVEVTAEDDSTTQTYTVTVTREGLPAEETEEELQQRMMAQYDANEDGAIDRDEVITAIGDYLFDGLITRDEVIVVISLYLFD